MSCNCIKMAEKRLKEETGDQEARIITKMAIVRKNGSNSLKDFIPIPVTYRPKKKDGSFGKPKKDMFVIGAYCPFCGKSMGDK